MTASSERTAASREGVRDFLAVAVGVAAWGLVTGVAMAQSTLEIGHAVAFALLAFAGSAQLAALPLMTSAAPVWLIVLTALVVNLRFVIYSAGLAKPLSGLTLRRRAWLSFLVGDLPFALYMRKATADPNWSKSDSYLAGMGTANWLVWQSSSITGILLGARIPREWGLELAGTLALLALVIPMVIRRVAAAVGVCAASLVAIAANRIPLHLGVLIAIITGVTAAMLTESLERRFQRLRPNAESAT